MKRYFLTLLLITTPAFADEKNDYHLFNPTPRDLMREMATDRPDRTESPYTVDAGHYQIEMSLVDYTYDDSDEGRLDSFSYLPVNVKAGLLNNVDIQFVYEPYIRESARIADVTEKNSGSGDLQTRLKVNLWGNDGGTTALALMPFVKFPTNTNDLGNNDIESGLIIPLAIALPGEWGMGLMTEFDFNRNAADDGYYTDFINTVTFSHAIVGDLSGYVEFFSSFNNEPDTEWVGTVDTGLTYGLTEDVQLDLGVNIGVTESADDLNPFCGLAMRY